MEYKIEVRIELKPGVIDAEGETVQKSLTLLGFPVSKVKSVKVYEVSMEADSEEEAKKMMMDACKRLLANPVIQDYSLKNKK